MVTGFRALRVNLPSYSGSIRMVTCSGCPALRVIVPVAAFTGPPSFASPTTLPFLSCASRRISASLCSEKMSLVSTMSDTTGSRVVMRLEGIVNLSRHDMF